VRKRTLRQRDPRAEVEERPELERKILEDLAKTGYPVEIRACMVLQAAGWTVTHNPAYLDLEEHKGREIDLRAITVWWAQRPAPPPHYVACELFVECKKSDKPWVFFVTPLHEVDRTAEYIHFISAVENLVQQTEKGGQQVLDGDFLRSSHAYFQAETWARTYYEAFKGQEKGERPPAIFSALSAATKALLHEAGRFKAAGGEVFPWLSLFWYPVVVFSGPLYEATVPVAGDISLASSSHVRVGFNYIASGADPTAQGERFVVDVVHESFLAQYVAMHAAFHSAVASRLESCFREGTVQLRAGKKDRNPGGQE